MEPLLNFNKKNVFSILEINLWLNSNWSKYKDLIDEWKCPKCPTDKGLPCICVEPDDEWKFFKLYEALDELLKKHKKEKYFEQEMVEYYDIQYSEIDLKIWTAKNEKLGVEDYSNFEFDYLDYECKNDGTKHLRVANSELYLMVTNVLRKQLGRNETKSKSDYEIYVNRNDFKYTLEFLEIFNDLFWSQEILSERLELINKEMEQIN